MELTTPATRGSIATVAAVYAAQGLGFALMVTSFPAMKERYDLSDTLISLLLLSIALTAAAGSLLANSLSIRFNSRRATLIGLTLQAVGLATIATAPVLGLFAAGVVIYGVGLGTIDAASAMQGVLAQRGRALPLLGRFFAINTVAAIVATLLMSVALGTQLGAPVALGFAAVVMVAIALLGRRGLLPEHAARTVSRERASRLPLRPILIFGTLMFAAFAADSAVSSWSGVYLGSALDAAPSVTPLGYGVYLVFVLGSRLTVDFLSRRMRESTIAIGALSIGAAGFAVIAFVPALPAAMIGLALVGTVAGALVPITFTVAGRAIPERSDELIARVNLFQYAGSIVGAVLTGLVGEGIGLGLAFLLPLAALVIAIPAAASILHSLRSRGRTELAVEVG